jgi:hypothetical protein
MLLKIRFFDKKDPKSAYLSSKIYANSARVWTRSTSLSSFQWSNWSPTYILHLFHLEDTSHLFRRVMLLKIRFFDKKDPKLSLSELLFWMTIFKSIHMAFYLNPSWACTLFHMLFIVSKQCACSRRVQIEGHMNRFEYCHPEQ